MIFTMFTIIQKKKTRITSRSPDLTVEFFVELFKVKDYCFIKALVIA